MKNENSYALQRHIEGLKNSTIIEPNKEALLKYIETASKYSEGLKKKYLYGLPMLINIVREINDIDLTKLTRENIKKTFERLNNLRWLYAATSFTILKQRWVDFLRFIKIEYNLDFEPKAEAKAFNIEQRSKFMTISKPIKVKT